ncbi:flavohemoglobin expression-modulating QEGLA motif protein [Ferrimonas kyonanensis]|uniref:flavohemoglobin expression-modulating QEGLA motif protein n=1 Tax=Ferrimonas kyonanensis TaxID=364763 RepID=UPI00055219AE|nr:flavohemoglobin expression-modulating QEGLA motif protein [Ferrimonas kyonanensis]
MMQTLSLSEALSLIARRQPFHAEVDGVAQLKIEAYLPVVSCAIHAGHRLSTKLTDQCLLSAEERRFEEDPATDLLIASQPITLVGCDSRFEYDLNRAQALSTYFKSAWSKPVWRRPLSARKRNQCQQKHRRFYQLYDGLIAALEQQFGHVLVFDLHSYNYQRIERKVPVFNIGTSQIDMERWGPVVQRFNRELGRIRLPNLSVESRLDEVFQGRGYLIAHTTARFDRTLVLPTEVKKVFMDEHSGELYPQVMAALALGLKEAFTQTSARFERQFNRRRQASKHQMLASRIDPNVVALDNALYQLAKGMETLPYINPVNLQQEKQRYLANPNRYRPDFRYRQQRLNPFAFREGLYRLPFDSVADVGVRQLYQQVADNLSLRVELITSVGSDRFRYNSLRYYGRPDERTLKQAGFLLQAATMPEVNDTRLTVDQVCERLRGHAREHGIACQVQTSGTLAAKAMVMSEQASLMINRHARFSEREAKALAHHELGVHMTTTINGRAQPLKLLSLGLPGNTETQEGLAILAEYHGGCLTLGRLRLLAARVVAVDSMLRDDHLPTTVNRLIEEAGLDQDDAFTVAARAYRGGGLTKDYQYLSGFCIMLSLHQQRDLSPLYTGKCALAYLDILEELCQRGWLNSAMPLTPADSPDSEPVMTFVLNSLTQAA